MTFIIEFLKSLLLNPAVQAILFGGVVVLIGWIVKKTKTKKDDAVWAIIEGAMYQGFNLAEKLIPDGTKNAGMKRLDEALKVFNSRVIESLNRTAKETEIEQAKALWSMLAYEGKKKSSASQ